MTMHEPGKSDRPVVPEKFAKMNYWDFQQWYVERMKGRGLAKENEQEAQGVLLQVGPAKQVDRTQSRVREGSTSPEDLPSALDRVRQAACRDKRLKFTSLWHHVYNVNDHSRGRPAAESRTIFIYANPIAGRERLFIAPLTFISPR